MLDDMQFGGGVWTLSRLKQKKTENYQTKFKICCDVAVAQINYPNLKHNTQDSIEQARGRSYEEGLVQIFMLYNMQFGGVWKLSRLKQKKTENYQAKLN